MKIKFLSLIIIAATLFSCKTPEPRKPVSRSSGSFIKESIKRNQKLVAKEEKRISEIIQKDSIHNYISSTNGFWYYYNTKIEKDTLTPDFGDLVNFEWNLFE